jgi:hypothetical protein
MDTVQPPKTIDDFEKVLASILQLQANPYCDRKMFLDLVSKETEVRIEIALLNNATKTT